jgi:hypothetical protein
MNAVGRTLLILLLALAFGKSPAYGQGALGDEQFRRQIEDARRRAEPAMQETRDLLARARAQGINTTAAENELNRARQLLNHPEL